MTDKVLRIEVKEKGTRAFYKEVVSVINQYLRLIKKPERNIRDSFKELKVYMVICAAFLVVLAVMGIAWGFDALTVIAIIIMLAVLIVAGILLRRLNDMVKAFLDDPNTSVLTLDEEGVELNKEGSQLIRLTWDNVLFVRVFQESVCFFAKGVRGMVIAVNRSHEQEVLEYLKNSDINVRIIGR